MIFWKILQNKLIIVTEITVNNSEIKVTIKNFYILFLFAKMKVCQEDELLGKCNKIWLWIGQVTLIAEC